MASNATHTRAEKINFSRTDDLRNFCAAPSYTAQRTPGVSAPLGYLDTYGSTLDQDFGLDLPVFAALLPQLAQTDPDGTAILLSATFPPEQSLPPAAADRWLDKMLKSLQDALIGGGNIGGNLSASVEASLRAAWRRQAAAGFKTLLAGDAPSIRVSPYITITASRIGKGGELRKGARLVVHVKGLPTTVLQKLEQPFVVRPSGSTATVRIGARDVQRIEQAATSVAGARAQASRVLRYAGYGKGSVLAFGPSAAIDLYDSYTAPSGAGFATDFAIRSAKSQSGNAIGFGAGLAAGVAVTAIGITGAPVILVGLGVGIVAQAAWGYFGGDDASADLVKGWLD